jgi:hypothetical protein
MCETNTRTKVGTLHGPSVDALHSFAAGVRSGDLDVPLAATCAKTVVTQRSLVVSPPPGTDGVHEGVAAVRAWFRKWQEALRGAQTQSPFDATDYLPAAEGLGWVGRVAAPYLWAQGIGALESIGSAAVQDGRIVRLDLTIGVPCD